MLPVCDNVGLSVCLCAAGVPQEAVFSRAAGVGTLQTSQPTHPRGLDSERRRSATRHPGSSPLFRHKAERPLALNNRRGTKYVTWKKSDPDSTSHPTYQRSDLDEIMLFPHRVGVRTVTVSRTGRL